MKTEITRSFTWGFLLGEQDLRRIFTACKEHAAKIGIDSAHVISVKLRDGSIIDTEDLEEVLSLENAGSKAIQRITLRFVDEDLSNRQIKVDFLDGAANPENWNSVLLQVTGASRDTVFLAAAELEERVKKTKSISWPYLTSRKWFTLIPLALYMGFFPLLATRLSPQRSALVQLEHAYSTGTVQNPIEAIIFYEKAKQSMEVSSQYAFLGVMWILPFVLVFGVAYLAARFLPAYNFYVGDNIGFYEKRRAVSRVIWGVFVLGLIASLVAGVILRYF